MCVSLGGGASGCTGGVPPTVDALWVRPLRRSCAETSIEATLALVSGDSCLLVRTPRLPHNRLSGRTRAAGEEG